jgi:Ser/Thr protein kinase RdoA (MazF antagonist)
MELLNILNENYPIRFERHEQLRDGGSTSYAVFSNDNKYFLRIIKPVFYDTAVKGVDIQVFLQNKGFPVPSIIHTNGDLPYIHGENELYILYEFIEGSESDPEQDAEAIGELIGKLHCVMKDYPGELIKRDKHFFIGRYIDILINRKYPRINEFSIYGDKLWEQIKDLPRGFCHGDVYSGNIHKTPDGKLFLLDFDTSCDGFPMYDAALICDMTDYFKYDEQNYEKSNNILSRFMQAYMKFNTYNQAEINAFHSFIAIQHFSTQATVMEIFGHDCLNDAELDYQLDWLYRWREQCESEAGL